MRDLSELYQEVILDHNRRPRNFRVLEPPTPSRRRATIRSAAIGSSSYLHVDGDVIADVGFQGSGCAISKASASLMTDSRQGQPVAEAARCSSGSTGWSRRRPTSPVEDLGKLSVLAGVREFPVRVKCASLAWHTLKAALNQAQRRRPDDRVNEIDNEDDSARASSADDDRP